MYGVFNIHKHEMGKFYGIPNLIANFSFYLTWSYIPTRYPQLQPSTINICN